MTRSIDIDQLLDDWLGEGPNRLADRVVASITADIQHAAPKPRLRLPWRIQMKHNFFAFAGAAVVAVFAVGVALSLYTNRPGIGANPSPSQPGVTGSPPAETPTPEPTPTFTSKPTAEPTMTAGPTPTLMLIEWNSQSGSGDWPAPPRVELPGAGVETVEQVGSRWWSYSDAVDDTAPGAVNQVDISSIHIGLGCVGGMSKLRCIELTLAGSLEDPLSLPAEAWYGFGIVLDVDSDGVPDYRYGIDNSDPGVGPIDRSCNCRVRGRVWRADLRTGEVEVVAISQATDDTFLGELPGTDGSPAIFHLKNLGGRFYAWSSLIADGQVVATDYAPNMGWLELVNQ